MKVLARGDDRIAEEWIRKQFSQDLSTQLRYRATRRGVRQVGPTRFARAHALQQLPVTYSFAEVLRRGQFGVMLRALRNRPQYAEREGCRNSDLSPFICLGVIQSLLRRMAPYLTTREGSARSRVRPGKRD